MAVRTTVDIPNDLHHLLRSQAELSGKSVRSLIVEALELKYRHSRKGKRVTGPLVIVDKRKLGPRFPVDENPPDLALS
jgi:hypothetical protein